MAETITWSVGGTAVAMEWQTCSMIDHGGYDSFQGSFPWAPATRSNPFPSNWAPGVALTQSGIDPVGGMQLPRFARQGQVVIGTRQNGNVVWKGVIRQTPRLSDGRAEIVAEGWKVLAERANERLPYQIADATQWSQQEEKPFNFPSTNGERFRLLSKKDALAFIMTNNSTYAIGDQDGYGLYTGTTDYISRVRFTHRTNGGANSWDIRTIGDKDFSGSPTSVDNYAWNTADGTAKSIDMTGANYNIVYMNVRATANGAPGGTAKDWLDDIRVNGTSISADTATGGTIAADLASRLGMTDKTQTGAVNVFPLDWTGQWSDLLDYLALVEDYCWLITEDVTNRNAAALYFRPYGNKSWRTTTDLLGNDSLQIAPLYNRSTTYFERPRGVLGHRTGKPSDFGLNDPLQGSAINYPYPEPTTLPHSQRATDLADALNQNILRRFTKYRLQGQATVLGLVGTGVPYDMKAGDLLTIGDFVPPVGAQRIAAVNYNSDGTATVTLDRQFDLADLLVRMRHKMRKHRR